MSSSNRGSSLFALVLLLGLAGWGAWLVYDGSRERGLATARLVDVDAARAAAADPSPVRLRGLLVGLPSPPTTPEGEVYALQRVTMTYEDDAGEETETRTVYDRRLPEQLFLSGRDSAISMEMSDLDERYLPVIVRGETDRAGRLPDSVTRHIGTIFTEIPTRRDGEVEVVGIRAVDTVNVYGALVMQDGFPVLTAPDNGDPLIISTDSFDEIQRRVAENDRGSRVIGWLMIALGLVAAGVVWWFGLRRA